MAPYRDIASENSWHLIIEMLGCEYIASGAFRDVFAIDNDWVIKVARLDEGSRIGGIRANLAEFELWCDVSEGSHYKRIRDWLAPIREITFDGVGMIQARTTPAKESEIPTRIPRWMTDTKVKNGGMLNGRFVFHDYQWILGINDVTRNHALVKARWQHLVLQD